MQVLSLALALILMPIALFGTRGRLMAMSLSWLAVLPALMPFGLRSAIFVPELVISVALVAWVFRSRKSELKGAPGWCAPQVVILILWTIGVTTLGLILVDRQSELVYRVPMAAMRMAAVLCSFALPASVMLDAKQFAFAFRFVRWAFAIFLAVAIIDYSGLLPVQLYFQERSSLVDVREFQRLLRSGGLDRASLGTFGILGMFVCLLSLQLRLGSRLLSIAGFLGFIFLVLISSSRSSLMGLIGFGIASLLLHRGNRMRNAFIIGFGGIAGYFVATMIPFVAARLETLTSFRSAVRSSGRVEGWKHAVEYLTGDPLRFVTGVGYDNWGSAMRSIVGLSNGHNGFLHVWGELGAFGAAIYLSIFFTVAFHAYRAMAAPGESRIIGGLTLALLCGLATANLTIVVLYPIPVRLNIVHANMFMLGLLYGRIRYLRAEQHLALQNGATDRNGVF